MVEKIIFGGINLIRGWQGHGIERRWFSALIGSFEIKLIKITNWKAPNKKSKSNSYILKSKSFDILCIPKGYISSIKALEEKSKLLVMSDYHLNEVNDEYRFDSNYFTI